MHTSVYSDFTEIYFVMQQGKNKQSVICRVSEQEFKS